MCLGHHTHQDGISQFQSFYVLSDNPETAEYPFFKKAGPTYFQWFLIVITMPISWCQYLIHYFSKWNSLNCIKRHSAY